MFWSVTKGWWNWKLKMFTEKLCRFLQNIWWQLVKLNCWASCITVSWRLEYLEVISHANNATNKWINKAYVHLNFLELFKNVFFFQWYGKLQMYDSIYLAKLDLGLEYKMSGTYRLGICWRRLGRRIIGKVM